MKKFRCQINKQETNKLTNEKTFWWHCKDDDEEKYKN